MIRNFITLLLLTLPAPAQLWSPYNVELMPGATAQPLLYGYRPHILLQWDPNTTPAPLSLHVVGVQVKLTVRELFVVHPPGWTGSWGGFNVGTRLKAENWPAIYQVWPWGGGDFDYFRGLDIELSVVPGDIGVDYGNWSGVCCYGYHPVPMLCVMLIEVG